MTAALLEKIKSWGYWRINFRPFAYTRERLSLTKCMTIVQENAVELRGWDYPHFPRRQGEDTGLAAYENYYEGWIDWRSHKEVWRMYQSGQFIHCVGLCEDWFEEDDWSRELVQQIKPGTSVGVIGSVVYELTEVYEFLTRLTRSGVYPEGAEVSLSLHGTKGRKLWMDDRRRMPLSWEYKTQAETIRYEKKYGADEIAASAKDMALDVMLYVFERFEWYRVSRDVLVEARDRLLARRV